MTMVFRKWSAAAAVLLLVSSAAATGCGRWSISSLKAQKAFKEANDRYKAQDWRQAAERYEYALSQDPTRYEILFFVGNSYDNMYKPSRAGEKENDSYMQKAIDYYKKAATQDPSPQMKKLSLQYLVAAYGSDKLNDPSQAEPIVQQMIQMDPNDPEPYFQLVKIYEEAGRYEDAEAALVKARDAKPNDPQVHRTIAGFYNRQGIDFAKTMEAMQKAADLEPNNPEGFYTVGTYYEEKVRKDFRLSEAQKREYIQKGLEAENKALSLNPEYAEAMVYKNILMRHQARTEKDRPTQERLIREADDLLKRAQDIMKKRTAGTAAAPAKK